MTEEYCWAITQAAGRSCCGRSGSSVLEFGFQLDCSECTKVYNVCVCVCVFVYIYIYVCVCGPVYECVCVWGAGQSEDRIPEGGKFCAPSIPVPSPTQPPVQCVPGLFSGCKAGGEWP